MIKVILPIGELVAWWSASYFLLGKLLDWPNRTGIAGQFQLLLEALLITIFVVLAVAVTWLLLWPDYFKKATVFEILQPDTKRKEDKIGGSE